MENVSEDEGSPNSIRLTAGSSMQKHNLLKLDKGHTSKPLVETKGGSEDLKKYIISSTAEQSFPRPHSVTSFSPMEAEITMKFSATESEELKTIISPSTGTPDASGKVCSESKTTFINPVAIGSGTTVMLKKYVGVRNNANPVWHAKNIFSQTAYINGVMANEEPDSLHKIQAYKYRTEAFTQAVQSKFTRNKTLYPGSNYLL